MEKHRMNAPEDKTQDALRGTRRHTGREMQNCVYYQLHNVVLVTETKMLALLRRPRTRMGGVQVQLHQWRTQEFFPFSKMSTRALVPNLMPEGTGKSFERTKISGVMTLTSRHISS